MIFPALIFVKHILIQDYAPILCVEFHSNRTNLASVNKNWCLSISKVWLFTAPIFKKLVLA
jgi:hypothetical protein